jgi:hypothetical protein
MAYDPVSHGADLGSVAMAFFPDLALWWHGTVKLKLHHPPQRGVSGVGHLTIHKEIIAPQKTMPTENPITK